VIPELGHFALLLALALAALQTVAGLAGAHWRHQGAMEASRSAALLQFAFCAVAFAALTAAYLQSDFSVANVAAHSHSLKPLLYKITGVWGNHEGSMLLWVLILALFGALVALFGRNLPETLAARVTGIQGLVGVAFLLFITKTSNPFWRLSPVPLDGSDLNPILQDPGLAFHPPLLYIGYVGYSVTFAFAVAALIEGRIDAAWARWVRPWALGAWIALTLGIALGSWWAYYELGWGGFWFWDPVENASLLPWLAGAALLHSAIVCERREALKAWTVFLALLAFSFSLLGTFLVRSGVLTSVHAFANDPERGVYILMILALTVAGSFALFAWRAPMLKSNAIFSPVSRETALLVNNLFLTASAFAVLIGTLYPVVIDVLTGAAISVGAPYFNITVGALFLPLLLLVPLGPMLPWKRAELGRAAVKLWAALGAGLLGAGIAMAFVTDKPVLSYFAAGLAVWLMAGALTDIAERTQLFRVAVSASLSRAAGLPRAAWGGAIAHFGVGVSLLGIVGVTAWASETIRAMKPGDSVAVGAYTMRFEGVSRADGPNYNADRAEIVVLKGESEVTRLYPERRFFPVQNMATSEVSIRTTGFYDLYGVLGEKQTDGVSYTVRLHHKPFAPWIWLGALIMGLGGLVSLTDRRLRVGVPRVRRQAAPVAAAAE
jgi:cytochrome c-type biogenesis protein CcmF